MERRIPKLLGQNVIGLGCAVRERIEKSESIRSFIYAFDVHIGWMWMCKCVSVYKQSALWSVCQQLQTFLYLVCASHRISCVCSKRFSFLRFCILYASLFSITESNQIGMQFAIHVACSLCGSGMGWDGVFVFCIVGRFWALVSHSMHLCVWVCVYGCDFDSHCKRHTRYFLCWRKSHSMTLLTVVACLTITWQQRSFTVGFWYLMLKYSAHQRCTYVSIVSLSILVDRTLCLDHCHFARACCFLCYALQK